MTSWARRRFNPRASARRLTDFALIDTNIVFASVILTNLLRAVSSVVLTRLLVPEAFGIAGIIASVSFTLGMMADLGFQPFVVRHRDGDEPRFLNTVWTIAIIRSLIIMLVMAGLSQPIANLIGKPDLAILIAVASIGFLIDGFASLTLMTALRHRMVLRLSAIELGVALFQLVVATGLAFVWRDYWALLIAMLLASGAKTALSYIAFANAGRRFGFDKGYALELWKFARFVTGSSLITIVIMQFDKWVLAALMPLDEFGFYILAVNLASAPLAFTAAYPSRVLYPYCAQIWRDGIEDLRARFYAKRQLPSLLYCFAAGGLVGSAPLVVAILYQPTYAKAAIYLQLLAIGPMFALSTNSANEALVATGRIQASFYTSIARLIWLGIAAPTGYMLGKEIGLVAAVGLMEPAILLFKWAQLHNARLLDMRHEAVFLMAGGAGVIAGMAFDYLLRQAHLV